MWEAVRGLRDQGITVVLTTHYMEEADELCDRLAVIDHGRILVQDTPAALKASLGGERIIELKLASPASSAALANVLRQVSGVTDVESTDAGLRVLAHAESGIVTRVVSASAAHDVVDVSTAEASLEAVFIKLTGKALRE